MQKRPTAASIKTAIVKALKDNKAVDVLAFNIKSLTDIADYMIIATANSNVHVKTLIEKTRENLSALHVKPIGTEGENTREWMLIDYGDVILHVMLDSIRKFYDLETLWGITETKIKSPKIRQNKPKNISKKKRAAD